MEAAVLLKELDAEVRLVDPQAGDDAAVAGRHGDALVLGGDLLRRLEDRLHQELPRASAGDPVERGADPAPFAADAVALGALGLALGVEEQSAAGLWVAGEVGAPVVLRRGPREAADVGDHLADLLLLEG